MIQIHQDWKELLNLLTSENVDYLIIGGVAVAYHSVPRYTGGLDILVRPSLENGERVVKALDRFGFGNLQIDPRAFTLADQMLSLGNEPLRVELFTSIPGVSFDDAWPRRADVVLDGVLTHFISREDLIAGKKADPLLLWLNLDTVGLDPSSWTDMAAPHVGIDPNT